MNSILHLESILSKVDHLLLDEGLKDFEVHQEGFRKLGELYLLSSLEQHQICDTTTNFVRTQDELAHIFPTVLSGTLSSTWKSVYEDVLRLRDYDSSQNKSDILGSLFQRLLTTQYVQDKGIVFTPQPIVEHILSQVGFQSASFNPVDSLIDLSCGSGIFLARSAVLATRVAVKQGLNISKILDYVSNKIIGFDIDPDAVFISHVNLIDQLLEELGTKFALDYIFQPNIFQTNSLLRNNKADIANVRKLK